MKSALLCTILSVVLLQNNHAYSQGMQRDFNVYILKAVSSINAERAGGGYDIHSSFTRDLDYGAECCIQATNPPKTMCVAAVLEIALEAMKIYRTSGSTDPYNKRPMKFWSGGTKLSIRPYIYRYKEVKSPGSAHAFQRFGMGREVDFTQLEAGDFINFSRKNGTGHAAVFLSYLSNTGQPVTKYSDKEHIRGFRYFSAQGKGKLDAGFAYRNAFFGESCPNIAQRDCGVIENYSQQWLNTGFLSSPASWADYAEMRTRLASEYVNAAIAESSFAFEPEDPAIIRRKVLDDIGKNLPAPDLSFFSGETTD